MSIGDRRFAEEIRERERKQKGASGGDLEISGWTATLVIVGFVGFVVLLAVAKNLPESSQDRADESRIYQRMEDERATREYLEQKYPYAPDDAIDRSTKRIVDEWDRTK